jgi:hypothetical protein
MQAYRTHYKWMTGLTVRDWRYVVRICNIDKSLLKKDAATGGADLPDLIFQGMNLIPNMNFGRPVLYMSRDTMTFIRRQLSSATNLSTLSRENVGGTMTDTFQGVPMRRCDSLAADESRVT